MNKHEAIERIESNALSIGDNDLVVGLNVAKHIINQINEPHKVAVPKFVAEYIEYCKHEKFYALHGAYANMDGRLKCWRFKGNNSELFAKAWLFGYEVEKEKLYTVEIPNPNGSEYSKTYLGKYKNGKVVLYNWLGYTSIDFADNWKQEEKAQLTESEIKQDFDWAWQFAKEVEE